MKKLITGFALAVSLFAVGCKDKGNPQGALGVNDKGDTTAFEKEDEPKGRSEATKGDSLQKHIGPANDKNHVADSEDKQKH